MRTEPRSAALRLNNLGKRYGRGGAALRNVTTTVPAGTTVAVLGPSGSGKSTLLRLVAGLETPSEGEVLLGERTLSAPDTAVGPELRNMSMVFQDYALWPHLPVRDIIGYGLRHGVHRVSAAQRAERVAELTRFLHLDGLGDRRPAELSGGQRQRVAIARALATRPRLLLFDEPLSNLDVQLRDEMREELAMLLSNLGTTALYVTHDVGEALALADRILVLHNGRVVQEATPQELFVRPASGWVASLAGFSCRLALNDLIGDGESGVAMVGGDRLTGRHCGMDAAGSTAPTAYVHPDAVRLDDGPAALRGMVVSSVFEGRQHRLRISLGDSGTLRLSSPEPRQPGTAVGVAVDPDGVLLFGEACRAGPLVSPSAAPGPESPDRQHRHALHR